MMEKGVQAEEGRADSLTMQCGTLCISALIQLSLIDINLRVAKSAGIILGGVRVVRCGTKKADPFHYARYEKRGKPEGLWGGNTLCSS